MEESKTVKVAIAESSLIIRIGLAQVLKRIQGMTILPIEVMSPENLHDCMRLHQPEILIVNPAFQGYFDLQRFKESSKNCLPKYVALVCGISDQALLKNYDEAISLYDEPEMLKEKIERLLEVEEEEEVLTGQDILSGREKEIIIGVVKGMTNKEIADSLFLSTHTVITHRRNIARKLQIHSPAGLTIYAIVNKLVELEDIKSYLA